MRTVTLGLASRAGLSARAVAAMGGDYQGEFITFATPELLFEVLNAERWEIIRAMLGAGKLSVDGIASLVGRKAGLVLSDVEVLLHAGILDGESDGVVDFPYDAIHVDFTIMASPLPCEEVRQSLPACDRRLQARPARHGCLVCRLA